MFFPSCAALIQHRIGATNAWGYDLSAACSGFIFALQSGSALIESGQCEKVLIVGVDTMSSILNYEDRNTCILFGDGAGAVLLEPSEKYGIIDGNLLDNSNNTYQVTDMVEKPEEKNAPSNMAIIGRYILTPDIFNILKNIKPDKSGEIQITDALKNQAKRSKVIAYKFKGKHFDCGSIKGYIEATNHFANKLSIDS